jgi:hypothetical protein
MAREDVFIPEHKTNFIPLRFVANNIFHPASMWFFRIGLKANDRFEYAYSTYKFRHFLIEKIGFTFYHYLDKVYSKWGTIYKWNMPLDFNLDDGLGWDDYDSDGIPYWDYFWHEDPETGDAWRYVQK